METMRTISAALKLIDVKKENLRKAFEELQSHSSFNLTWPDLDSYFTSLHSDLDHKFKILQSQNEQEQQLRKSPPSKPQSSPIQPQSQSKSLPSNSKLHPIPPQSETHSQPQSQTPNPPSTQSVNAKGGSDSVRAPARPELKSFCEKMDGLGLREYIVQRPEERYTIKSELADALRCAPDAAAMVLGAMEGFYAPNSLKADIELSAIRNVCVILLENLRSVNVDIVAETREKARNLAVEWKGKISTGFVNKISLLAFLHLLAAYGVVDAFDVGEVVELAAVVATRRGAIELFRVLDFGDRISDIILKLIGQGNQLMSVRLILEFELSAKFPPVHILEEYIDESQQLAKKALEDKERTLESQNKALAKEATAYRSVIKIIEEYKLAYDLKEKLIKRLEIVAQLKSNMKSSVAPTSQTQQQSKPQELSGSKHPRNTTPACPTASPMSVAATSATVPSFQHSHQQPEGLLPKSSAAPASQTQQQSKPQKLSGSKHPRNTSPARPTTMPTSVAATSSTVPAIQHSHQQPAGLLPKYLGSPAGPYGLAGSTAAVAPCAGSSAASLYGSTGAIQHSHQQLEGLLPKYSGSLAGPYGLAGSTAAIAPYAGSSAASLYGSTGAIQHSRQQPERLLPKYLGSLAGPYGLAGSTGAVAPASQTQHQSKPQKPSGSTHLQNTAPARPTAIPVSVAATSSTLPAMQHSHQQPKGLLPKYLGSPAGPYGLAGSTAVVAPYAGSSAAAGLYGSTGAPGNLMPSQPNVYPSESNMATGYYDRPVAAYGGYSLPPQYHQPYYPQ